jgi:biopolymer transport protein ExbB
MMFSFTEFGILAEGSQGMTAALLDFLSTGGYVMLLIVLCSFATVTSMILVGLQLREKVVMPAAVVSQLKSVPNYALKGDIQPLQDFLEQDGSMLSRLGGMAVSGSYASREDCQEACAARAKEELHALERGMPVLEAMVTVAPLLGLMGTTVALVGMFTAFGGATEVAGPDTNEVAREIGVALKCTIAGLFVAVPSVLAHTYFGRRLDTVAVKLETLLQETIHHFFTHFEVQQAPDQRG